jgi:hypothetical protein
MLVLGFKKFKVCKLSRFTILFLKISFKIQIQVQSHRLEGFTIYKGQAKDDGFKCQNGSWDLCINGIENYCIYWSRTWHDLIAVLGM